MHAMIRFTKIALTGVVVALVVYAILAAPGFLSDQASTVPIQSQTKTPYPNTHPVRETLDQNCACTRARYVPSYQHIPSDTETSLAGQ
jgi:hypothetical protein